MAGLAVNPSRKPLEQTATECWQDYKKAFPGAEFQKASREGLQRLMELRTRRGKRGFPASVPAGRPSYSYVLELQV